MKVIDANRYLSSIGIDIDYGKLRYIILKNDGFPWDVAYELHVKYPDKDILAWKNTKWGDFEKTIKLPIYIDQIPISKLKKKTCRKKSIRNLLLKHGRSFFIDLKNTKNIPYHNLKELGKKYGFSRERARQIYNIVYQEPYSKALVRKKIKMEETQCIHNPARKVADYEKSGQVYQAAVSEKLFMNKCEELGFEVDIPCTKDADIVINGFIVDVKTSKKLCQTSKKMISQYHHYQISKTQREICNFFACYMEDAKEFFIIPNEDIGNTISEQQESLYISQKIRLL